MKRNIKYIILFFLIVFAFLNYGKAKMYADRWINFSFCDEPILYKVGAIDPRFNISREQIIKDTLQAAELWNNIAEKELFKLDPSAELEINLVYDERQKSLAPINQQKTQIEIDKDNLTYNAELFSTKQAEIEKKLEDLNREIEEWNTKGGAPKKVYDDLIARQRSLQAEINDLNNTADNLNQSTERINSQIEELNSNVNKFNSLLTIKPEEGIYMGGQNKIEIYIYDNSNNFVHTVAHELGHALGLDHVNEETSILYPISSPQAKATQSDISALNNFCAQQNRLELIKNDLKNAAIMLFSQLQNVVT